MMGCRHARTGRDPADGFSLIEVAIAIGVFAFAIVGILALFPVAMHSARASRDETLVVHIARMVMSELRAGPFNAARVVTRRSPEDHVHAGSPFIWQDREVCTLNLGAVKNDITIGYSLVSSADGTQQWAPVGVVADLAGPSLPAAPPTTHAASPQASPQYTVRIQSVRRSSNPEMAHITLTVRSATGSGRYPFTVLVSERQ